MIAAPTDSEERCVWLAQCVCENNHSIMAYANEAEGLSDAKNNVVDPLHQRITDFIRGHNIEPTCAVCGGHYQKWRYCLQRTVFATMAEARPKLRAIQIDRIKRRFDEQTIQ